MSDGSGWAVKSATFNINSVNRRLPNLLGWLRVCLQELKATNEAFPAAAISSGDDSNASLGQDTTSVNAQMNGPGSDSTAANSNQ